MPTYEYQCRKCGRVFEVFQSITEPPKRTIKTDCAKCNNRAPVVRLIGTGAGVIFKGSGFYQTDYRSESYKQAAKADRESAAVASGKDDGKDRSKQKTSQKRPSDAKTSGKGPKKAATPG